MFSYYGSKSKIVDLYPPPKYGKIIEPFAGSARYAMKYWDREILLVDKYDVIVKVWKWLQKCSPNDILNLPEYNKKEVIDKSLTDEERWFVAFSCNRGSARPHNVAGSYYDVLPIWQNRKKVIAKDLHKIKHWIIQEGTYDEIPNFPDVTWFIDPPYKNGGEYYKFSSKELDFDNLGRWCMNRTGQIIVCENTKADWLPFKPMQKMTGQKRNNVEAIWTNHKSNYDDEQISLF
jgi:site-specific DNA-adenine methylase